MAESVKKIYVSGHRNPDLDSLASAVALAELRRRMGLKNVEALCPGILSEKARYLFDRFKMKPPVVKSDVYLRIRDVMETDLPTVRCGTTLLDAVVFLRETGLARLPIVDEENNFLGMLSPLTLLSQLLAIGHDSGSGLTGRTIHTSLRLITHVINGELLSSKDPDKMQDFKVYVAAMGVESFESHIPRGEEDELAIITGDRSEIQLRALQHGVRLIIVAGERPLEPLILRAAQEEGVALIKTDLDSAAAIRRLKFSVPVESSICDTAMLKLRPEDRLSVMSNRILNESEDVVPVVDGDGHYVGSVLKRNIGSEPPYRMILVDHNEVEQGIPGLEEIPIIEVVDHHRIGIRPTMAPIRFTGDVVGSTCTLVAGMYMSAGESLSPAMAGLLMGGVVSDTLNLKSPTTTAVDRRILEKLEKIAGVTADELMSELSQIDSPLASLSAVEVINADRKSYVSGRYRFSLSQVEETNLELLSQRLEELTAAMKDIMNADSLNFIGLMVTDAVREHSLLLVIGDTDILSSLPYSQKENGLYDLPGVLSRKKQLLPPLLALTLERSRS